MTFAFVTEQPLEIFRKIERDLKVSYPSLNLGKYKAMSSKKLAMESTRLKRLNESYYTNQKYGSWFSDENYLHNKLLQEALDNLAKYKKTLESSEVLIEGYTYYTAVKQIGSTLIGKRCTYLGEGRPSQWVNFKDHIGTRKAFEVIRHGDVEDFRNIYVRLADGLPDAVVNINEQHITKSSPTALREIERYCDSRWDGPWPWETRTSFKLKTKIEENKEMRQMELREMRSRFNDLLVQLNEGEVEKAQVILQGRDIVDKIQGMIEDLGKISGEGILSLKDMARSAIGDDAASQIEQAITQPLNAAADVLSKLRVQVDNCVNNLQSGDDHGGFDGGATDQFGSDDMPPEQEEEHNSMVDQATGEFDANSERVKKFR